MIQPSLAVTDSTMTASARANASRCISDVAAFDQDIAGVGVSDTTVNHVG